LLDDDPNVVALQQQNNPAFKTIPVPSRLESLLLAKQSVQYSKQVNQYSGQTFAKLLTLQALNESKK